MQITPIAKLISKATPQLFLWLDLSSLFKFCRFSKLDKILTVGMLFRLVFDNRFGLSRWPSTECRKIKILVDENHFDSNVRAILLKKSNVKL